MDWTQAHDCHFDTDRVPKLLEQVEHSQHGSGAEAWKELGYRLLLEHDLVSPAGFAALPTLVRLAHSSANARRLAGEIMERAAGPHGCDELLTDSADAVSEFRELLNRHLRSRPADDYLAAFRALLAVEEQYHWAAVLGDFTDDFYHLACPHCAVEVTVAVGHHGRYSAIRDWNLGDVDRRALRPASAEELSGTGRGCTRSPPGTARTSWPAESSTCSARRSALAVRASSPSRPSTHPPISRSCGKPPARPAPRA